MSSGGEAVSLDLATLLAADRVVISDNLNRSQATIEDPDRLAALRAVLSGLNDGWTVPPGGVPVAKVRLNFSLDGKSHGNLGVGRGFLSAHVHGGFVSRPSDLDTARSLLRALGMGRFLARL